MNVEENCVRLISAALGYPLVMALLYMENDG
jgi:hypothetical protein